MIEVLRLGIGTLESVLKSYAKPLNMANLALSTALRQWVQRLVRQREKSMPILPKCLPCTRYANASASCSKPNT